MKKIFYYLISSCFAAAAVAAFAATHPDTSELTIEQQCSTNGSCSLMRKTCNMPKLKATTRNLPLIEPASNNKPMNNIHWQSYSNEIFTQAKDSKKLIMLFGKSTECPWSNKMEQVTFNNPAVVQIINDDYLPVMFDLEKNEDIGASYKIVDLPSVIILNPGNDTIKVFTGYRTPDDMKNNLKKTAEEYKNNKAI